jgi:long-chain acyl-CoA synthetase
MGYDLLSWNNKNEYEVIEAWESFTGAVECGASGRLWNSDELRALSQSVADSLLEKGVAQGDIVAVILSNTVCFPVVFMALLSLRCNPLLLHGSTTHAELERVSHEAPVKYAVHENMKFVSNYIPGPGEEVLLDYRIENLSFKLSTVRACIHMDSGLQGSILHLTSGTNSHSKICIRNQVVAIAEARNYTSTIDIYSKARVVVTTPLSHAFAYGFGLMSSILTNSTLVIDSMFNPKKVIRGLANHPCDILTLVPPMVSLFTSLKPIDQYAKIARAAFYAGTVCDSFTLFDFEKTFGLNLYSIYGSTETGAISTNYCCGSKVDGLGYPLLNTDICITNTHNYNELGNGIGEISVKSDSMMQGYYTQGYDNQKKLEYFSTGDVGGYEDHVIRIMGRMTDFININGFKIDPNEIEEVVLSYEGILDAVVYPGRLSKGDEVVLCSICTDPDVNIEIIELKQYCQSKLSNYKLPQHFWILDRLPRTGSGKCLKRELPGYYRRELVGNNKE